MIVMMSCDCFRLVIIFVVIGWIGLCVIWCLIFMMYVWGFCI